MNEIFVTIAKLFQIPGTVVKVEPITNGHINETYHVVVENANDTSEFVFQKVNTFVFKEPVIMMENIGRITKYIAEKMEAKGISLDHVMQFMQTENGNYYVELEDGFWRISRYVPNTITHNACDNARLLESAGHAFGQFQTMLADFDATLLHETIPDFHNTAKRYATLLSHVEEDPCGRVASVQADIDALKELQPVATRLCTLLDEGKLPLRVTHNDTKINNVLFDATTDTAKTVIDLDTVMPGLVAHDFGDAIRFAANYAKEDEKDLTKVGLNLEYFRAFAQGFISEIAATMTPIEAETMALGALVMTTEVAVRFLDDYIVGDQYFKISYPDQNLVRARCQIKLAQEMLAHMDEMNAIIAEISAKAKA
ncbi:MAG: aminoglycoside phosphotransferase family protein [Clostridia bacterium]|nr:aminoglycoside phosphotransferase family protein [Clostridia bacterium]